MPKLNYDLIRSHVAEAREELRRIEAELASKPREGLLQVWFDHAFHHLNTAWNARHASDRRRRECSDEDFNRWGKFPGDINLASVSAPRLRSKRSRRSGG